MRCDPPGHPGRQLIGRDLAARDDERLRYLAGGMVGDADDGGVGDGQVLTQ